MMGMNLQPDTGKQLNMDGKPPEYKVRNRNQSRRGLKQEERKRNDYIDYQSKKDEPYNRTFETKSTDVIGRAERKKIKQQAKLQTGFVSWVLGLFTGLVGLLIMFSFLQSSDLDVESDWTASTDAESMISETASEETQTDVAPAEAESDKMIQETTEEVEDVDSNESEIPRVTVDGNNQ